MLPLTKMVSSGLTGLSATGLGAYFTPGLLTESEDSSNVIYFSNTSELSEEALSRFTKTNEEALSKLTKLSREYQTALAALINSIKKEHTTITDFFRKIQQSEQKLKEFYEKNKKYLEQLQEFIKQYYSTSEKKLKIEQLLHQAKYWNKSLLSVGNVISGWGLSLEKFLCAINDQDGKKTCDTEVKSWLSDSTSSAGFSSSSAQGGGTQASSDALKKLQEASDKIKLEKEKLKKLFLGTGVLNFVNIQNQAYLEKKNAAYEQGLLALQELQKQFNEEIQKVDQSSKEETNTLNKNYSSLQDSISKWEAFKKATSLIHQWRGKLQNSICELTFSSENKDCSPQQLL